MAKGLPSALLVALLAGLVLWGAKEWQVVQQGTGPPSWITYKVGLVVLEGLTRLQRHVTPPYFQALELAEGYWKVAATHHLCSTGALDAVATECLTCGEVARRRRLREDHLCRLMRAGAVIGMLHLNKQTGCYRLTPVGQLLQTRGSGVRELAVASGNWLVAPWYHLQLQEGTPSSPSAFERYHQAPFWELMGRDEEKRGLFHAYIASLSRRLACYMSEDLPLSGRVCDLGGGVGAFLIELLKSDERLSGVVVDLPEVIPAAEKALAEELPGRDVKAVAGDFLSVPSLMSALEGCDVVLLKHVLHDWQDQDVRRILKNLRAAMPPSSKVMVVEAVVPEAGLSWQAHEEVQVAIDLMMMVIFDQSKERTLSQYTALLQEAGFRFDRVIEARAPVSAILAH